MPIPIIFRDRENIQSLASPIPSRRKNDIDQKTDVLFLWDEFDDARTPERIYTNPVADKLTYISGAIVWNVRRAQYNKSGMKKFIGTKLYKNMTARNVNTLRRLAELMK
jgi:uncharacterized protein (DUF1697 family)